MTPSPRGWEAFPTPGALTRTRITWAFSPPAPQVPDVTPGSPLCPWCFGHPFWRGARHDGWAPRGVGGVLEPVPPSKPIFLRAEGDCPTTLYLGVEGGVYNVTHESYFKNGTKMSHISKMELKLVLYFLCLFNNI
jgi:hypothetical protein